MSEFYRILHFASLFFFAAGVAATFWGDDRSRSTKIVLGVSSFAILVAGMGLIARSLGLSHAEGGSWPLWLKIKLGLWLLLAVGIPVLSKRLKNYRKLIGFAALALMVVAAMLVTLRP